MVTGTVWTVPSVKEDGSSLFQEHLASDKAFIDVRAFQLFRGVPQLLVPDKLKATLKQVELYDPV